MDAQARRSQLLRVTEALRTGDRFLLVGHVDPDPDSIGSILALDWALQQMGKTSIPVSPDPLLPSWKFFPGQERVRLPHEVKRSEWDILVVVDCEPTRTGAVAAWADGSCPIINIDHHVTNPGTAAVTLLDTTAAAAGAIIYDIICALGLPIGPEVATLLFAAIMADTGSFRFSNTSARVLSIAADLVQHGAQPDYIAREIYETHTWGYAQLLQRVLSTLCRSEDGKAAWITVTVDMLNLPGVRKDETEGLIQYPRMIQGVEVALIFREIAPTEVRVGFRSKQYVDVSRLAQEFGGGGHPRAAGCTIHLPLAEARALVLDRVEQVLAGIPQLAPV